MIKIDIISGFLGAGKTTFIKKMLTSFIAKDEKIVIIENEFGKIGIDGELIRRDGFEVYELTNGCICCSLKSDFQFTLKEIIEKVKPNRIIFEPSGIFVLSDVLEILALPEFSSSCYINLLITIVDCVHFLKQNLKFGDFFNNQISNASTLVLSKSQLINKDDLRLIVLKLQEINPNAEILEMNWDGLTASDISSIPTQVLNSHMKKLGQDHECQTAHTHNHKKSHGFETYGTKVPNKYSLEELGSILKSLPSPNFGEVLRGKGFVPFEDGMLEFSYVDGAFSIEKKDDKNVGLISFIGIGLNKIKLGELFGIAL